MIPLFVISALAGYFLLSNTIVSTSEELKEMVSDKYDSLFKKYGAMYGIDWKMLKRISWVESNIGLNSRVAKGLVNPKDIEGSKSYDGLSWGLMQVTVTTAKDYDKNASAEKLNNPAYSIEIAAKHLKMLKQLFSNERDVVMSYNQGQGNQKKFITAEKSGTLKESQYSQARSYWAKYNLAKGVIV